MKEDIVHDEDILGPNLGSLKETTKRRVINTLDNPPNGMLDE